MADDKSAEVKEFTGWRSIFWPIHSFELKKFLLTDKYSMTPSAIDNTIKLIKSTLYLNFN